VPTAILVSGPILATDLGGGRSRLERSLVVDLGHPLDLDHTALDGFDVVRVGRLITTFIRAPKGFTTDFSSIPLWAQAVVMGPKDRYRVAGVIHDWCYWVGVPRGVADQVWRLVARSGKESVSATRGFLGWAALRLFGGRSYRRHIEKRTLRSR
jgi:hypothetical protein